MQKQFDKDLKRAGRYAKLTKWANKFGLNEVAEAAAKNATWCFARMQDELNYLVEEPNGGAY